MSKTTGHTTMSSTIGRVLTVATGMVAAAALTGCSSLATVHAASNTGTPTVAPLPSNVAAVSVPGMVRVVHSPHAVVDDMHDARGSCHVRVEDAAAGLVLPDAACTPGAVDPAVTQANIHQTICVSGYTATVRPPASQTNVLKREELAAYGEVYEHTTEEDHLVSLELGGTNTASNLWPEPNRSAASSTTNPKDAVENALHKAVCAGTVSLTAAQQAIATDWTTAEQTLGLTH